MKKLITVVLTTGCLLLQIAPVSADIREGLVSYWPLDTIDGTTTPDLCFGNHLVLNNMGATNQVASPHGGAFQFNGSSTFLGMAHTNDVTLTNNLGLPIHSAKRYTVMAWVNGAPAQVNKIIFCEGSTGGTTPYMLIGTRSGGTGLAGGVNVRTSVATGLPNTLSSNVAFDNTWHHIAWVDDNGAGKLYIDGVLDAASYNYTNTPLNLNTIAVGALFRNNVSLYFAGMIDEVALWERPLTQAEVDDVRTNGIATPVPLFAPIITSFSTNMTKHLGDHARFSVSAIGTRPFTYQWKRDGTNIIDATNQAYTAFHLVPEDSGTYSVEVTGPGGTTPTNCALTVLPDPTNDIANGLVMYWPFETVTNSPATTPDLYSQNDMLLNGMDENSLVTGQFGNALGFTNGFNQYATRVSGFPIYNNPSYSVSLWVNGDGTTQPAGSRIFSEASTNGNAPLVSLATDTATPLTGVATVFVRNDANSALVNQRRSTRVVFDNAWHHVVWVDDNGQGKLYVDGIQDETDFFYTRSATTLNTTTVGAILRGNPYNPVNFFTGAIDEVALWNRPLTLSEIQDIRANGVPAPTAAVPPSIAVQPADKTNNVFQGDTVTFSVQAAGTSPLNYQWNKNDLPISALLNSTATNADLVLTNVQAGDVAGYSVTITNVAGSTNSVTVQLTVLPYTPVTNGEILKLDFNDVQFFQPHPDYSSMTLPASGTNFNGVGVTLSPLGSTALGDRNRRNEGSLFNLTNNPPALTQGDLYNDFIFSTDAANVGSGMRILIERLAPNTQYGLTIWSWDHDNAGDRVSDWIETASGPSIPIATYTFNGNTPITHDYDATFGALLTSSSTGKLQIEGRKAAAPVSVFVNALRLVANPVMRIAAAELIGGNLRITIETQYPGQPISIQEKTDLGTGDWNIPASGGVVESHGPVVIAEFPASAGQTFYRVTSP